MTEHNYRVRRVQEKDISGWLRLRKILWDKAADEEHKCEMRDIFEHIETQLILVAETSKGKLVGFLEASIRLSKIVIAKMSVIWKAGLSKQNTDKAESGGDWLKQRKVARAEKAAKRWLPTLKPEMNLA